MPTGGLDLGIGALISGGLGGLGIGAETAAAVTPAITGGLEGAALGAGESLFTGGNPLTGALTGGLTGGAIGGFGPLVSSATGLGSVASDALVGTAAGAAGAGLTGGDPITGALTGGAGGIGAGLMGGASAGSTAAPSVASAPATGGGGGGGSAMATAISPGGINVEPLSNMAAPAGGTAVGDATNIDPFAASQAMGIGNPSGNALSAFQGSSTVPTDAAGGATGDWSPRPSGGIGSSIMGLVEKNPGILLAGGLLGANMLLGNKPLPAEAQLQQAAGEAGTQARTLAAYQQSGTLPAGLQAVVDQQMQAAKAAVVSQFGEAGLGNSSMMVDKLNQLKQQKSAEVAQFADNLAKQGVQWAQLSSAELGQLLAAQTAQENQFTQALGSFAGGLAGLRGTGTTTLAA